MAGTLRFGVTNAHGRERPGLVLTADRLVVWHGSTARELRLSELVAARWASEHHVELDLVGGERVMLAGIDQLEEAVAEIDRRAAAARAVARRSHGLPDGSQGYFRRRRWLRLGRALAISAGSALLVLLFSAARSRGDMDFALATTVVITVIVLVGQLLSLTRVTADGLLLSDTDGLLGRRLPWADLSGVGEVTVEHRFKRADNIWVSLATRQGHVRFLTHDQADVRLIRDFVHARRLWRDAEFAPAGAKPPPDTALSLVRETGERGSERGLSLAAGGDGAD